VNSNLLNYALERDKFGLNPYYLSAGIKAMLLTRILCHCRVPGAPNTKAWRACEKLP